MTRIGGVSYGGLIKYHALSNWHQKPQIITNHVYYILRLVVNSISHPRVALYKLNTLMDLWYTELLFTLFKMFTPFILSYSNVFIFHASLCKY